MASIARSVRIAAPAAARLAPRASPAARLPFRSFSTSRLSLARRYTKDHEWIDLSADRKTGVVGISEYAAQQLGDVVYVELPEDSSLAADFVEQGDAMGAVESVKSASDINAPIRLRVTTVNRLLEEKPATINQVPEDDSHGGGWIAKVELDDKGAQQFDELMDAAAYKQFTTGDE
jgi:glycine cleavage system H protein